MMQCTVCGANHPDEARFCAQCGTPIARQCTSCQAELAPNARFCSACGQPAGQANATDQDRLRRLASATPSPLAARMRVDRLAGERRPVTALFADVVGSTGFAEQMDAEDWTAIMNGAFERMAVAVYRYEGTVARLLGDAILAFFGAPVAHEDDPARAVKAALDMVDSARSYAEQIRARYGIDFAIRVGVNSGPVVVGNVGSDLVYEYTAMGDAMNLAARMQAAARPMTVLVTDLVFRATGPLFDFADIGAIEVKGKSEPVRAYEVVGTKATPGRLRGVTGLESTMVGRDAELAAIMRASELVQAGLGRAVAIVGEPGLGKSRLVTEWKTALQAEDASSIRWAEGHCVSYGRGLAYYLLRSLLLSLIGAPENADEAAKRAALRAGTFDLLSTGAEEEVAYLAHLLEVRIGGEDQERIDALDPQALPRLYLAAVRRVLSTCAERSPTIVVLDDIHWADSSSVDLLADLVPMACDVPLLFCLVTRPDHDAPGWKLVTAARDALGAGFTELPLDTLSAQESRQLLANLLAFEALPERLRAHILDRAGGNPFFVEEVVRMLIDRGAIRREGHRWTTGHEIDLSEIPDSLHGLLLARIDALPEEVKHTLRVASVIGRQFPLRLLDHVVAPG